MRLKFVVLTIGVGLCGSSFAGQIDFQTTDLGGNAFEITYSLNNITFATNQELDIEFDPALYVTLSAAVAPSSFDVLLLQPNNPPGSAGDLSALALVNLPAFVGQLSVDVVMAGNARPGVQDFAVNQLNANGVILSRVSSGQTVGSAQDPSPEPATLPLVGTAMLGACVALALRARRRKAA